MPTFNQVKQQIISELLPNGQASVLDTAVSNALVFSQKFYETERLGFNEEDTAVITIANQEYLTLGATFLSLDQIMLNENGSRSTIDIQPFVFVNGINRSGYAGKPKIVGYRDEKLVFDTIPDSSMTISISFHKKFSDLPGSASGSSENKWLINAAELLKSYVKSRVCLNQLWDFVRATMFAGDAELQLEKLKEKRNSRYSTNHTVKKL